MPRRCPEPPDPEPLDSCWFLGVLNHRDIAPARARARGLLGLDGGGGRAAVSSEVAIPTTGFKKGEGCGHRGASIDYGAGSRGGRWVTGRWARSIDYGRGRLGGGGDKGDVAAKRGVHTRTWGEWGDRAAGWRGRWLVGLL